MPIPSTSTTSSTSVLRYIDLKEYVEKVQLDTAYGDGVSPDRFRNKSAVLAAHAIGRTRGRFLVFSFVGAGSIILMGRACSLEAADYHEITATSQC